MSNHFFFLFPPDTPADPQLSPDDQDPSPSSRNQQRNQPKLPPLPGPTREELPIDAFRENIVTNVLAHNTVCVVGETGCGKSSRVPQYIYYNCKQAHGLKDIGIDYQPHPREQKDRLIVVTQPRRLACTTLAKRVSKEMGDEDNLVGYRIGGDTTFVQGKTQLLFVTTGYLLQLLVSDPLKIRRFSHLILDEVHERSVEADLVFLVLKLLQQRGVGGDFKLVLMSATVEGQLLMNYFTDIAVGIIFTDITVGICKGYLTDLT